MLGQNARFTVLRSFKKHSTKAVVRPASDRAKRGVGQVELKNTTKSTIFVNMPGGLFGSKDAPDEATVHKIESGDTLKLDVHPKAEEGVYEFQIFSAESFSFVEANSDPEIIIEA